MTEELICIAHGARSEEQRAIMKQIERDEVCPFCVDFCRGQPPQYHTKPILKESYWWALTENFHPYEGSVHHLLLVCKRHITTLGELRPWETVDAFRIFVWAARKYRIQGGAILLRFGNPRYTRASVAHLHFQLIVGADPNSVPEECWENNEYKIITGLGYKKPKDS